MEGHDLFDLSARCITQQVFNEESHENGLAYAALGLLSFGASKERNAVWERLTDPTREQLDQCFLTAVITMIISRHLMWPNLSHDSVLDLPKKMIPEK